ncbi:MAG: SurA N-terminal domain-containing protein [Bdellovibrionaceae bacterium]|nr:SurA N-terminal domain-containing protein [Pseudobdellovibrionaceae bacterium]
MSDNMATGLKRRLQGRKLGSKIIGYGLLAAIGLVFVFFGVNHGGGVGIGSVARVNNTLISAADFQNEENRVQQYFASLLGGSMDLSTQRNMLRRQAMENLVRAELASQAARHAGIVASDAEVASYIMNIPFFQENGQFRRDRYMAYLEGSRMNAGTFEERVRKDIENIRARHLVETSAYPTGLEIARAQELAEKRLNVAFAQLDADALARSLKASPAEVDGRLKDPEFVKKAEDYFQANKRDWSKEATVKAQHLLIMAKAGDAAAEEKALAKIRELRARADKEDFGKLAAQYSEDPGSKAKKGQLEPFTRGRMVKEFEDAAFSQKIGTLSEPVKTAYGYHLIKVQERTEAKEPSFNDVKNEVASRLISRDKAEADLKVLDEAVAKGEAARVDGILKNLGATWQETGDFDLAAEAVPKVPAGAVSQAVFEVTAEKPLLNRVVRDGGQRYVVKFKSLKTEPVKDGSLLSVDNLQRRRADGIYSAWLNEFRENSRVDMNPEVFRQ